MGGNGMWSSWFRWIPTSPHLLEKAEKQMLGGLKSTFKGFFVLIRNQYRIRTIESVHEDSERLPLVLLHGFGSAIGFWALNFDSLAAHRKVYAIDLLGFGRSSRPVFPEEAVEVENMFVESIEQWREEVGLEKFILLGHSFGGYLSAAYTMRYPERVRHLIMADPWGMPEKSLTQESKNYKLPFWAKSVSAVLSLFNPFAALRAAGPWGPELTRSLLSKIRPDIKKKYSRLFGEEDDRVLDYIYHINVQQASGEVAFMSLTIPRYWAKYPMIHRMKDIDPDIPISFLYGSRSWMDVRCASTVQSLRPQSHVEVKLIDGAGHQVFADKPDEFNLEVNKICERVS